MAGFARQLQEILENNKEADDRMVGEAKDQDLGGVYHEVKATLSDLSVLTGHVQDSFDKLFKASDARTRHTYLGKVVGGLNEIATETQNAAKMLGRVLDKMPRG